MNITPELKAFLIKTFGLAEDVSDADLKKCLAEKLVSGEVTAEKLAELSAGNAKAKLTDLIQSEVAKSQAPLLAALENISKALNGKPAEKSSEPAPASEKNAETDSDLDDSDFESRIEKAVAASLEKRGVARGERVSIAKLYANSAPRVKSAAERYSHTKSAKIVPTENSGKRNYNPLAGQQARLDGQLLDNATEREKACCGAYLKKQLIDSCPVSLPSLYLTEEDEQLLAYAAHEMDWCGQVKGHGVAGEVYGRLADAHRNVLLSNTKAPFLDDTTSGGQTAVPLILWQEIVTTPLLFGEILPHVTVKNLAKGRRLQLAVFKSGSDLFGAATEGSAVSLYDATALISELDPIMRRRSGQVEVGLDFVSDSPLDVFSALTDLLGRAWQYDLETGLATGNGTTHVQGITQASGITSVLSANGNGGPVTLGDLQSLAGSIAKEYRSEMGAEMIFLSNDATYQRTRHIPYGSLDSRRALGDQYEDYKTINGWKHAINAGITDGQLYCVQAKRYWLWIRAGLDIRVISDGITLAKNNTMAVIAAGRVGGLLTQGGAAAKMTNLSTVSF